MVEFGALCGLDQFLLELFDESLDLEVLLFHEDSECLDVPVDEST